MKRSKLLVFLFLFCLVNFLAKADITVNINGLTTVPQIQSAIQTGITSLSSSGGGIVTVINEDSGGNSVPYTNANGALTLNIPFDVSVFWNLNYSSSGAFIGPMLTLSGSGAFELINGSSLIHNFNGTGTAGGTTLRITGAGTSLTIRDGSNLFSDLGGYGILIAASNVTINVNSNGIIKSSTGNSNAAIHINNDFQGIVINVDGGSIISEDSGYAIEDGTGTATIPNNALINVGNETNSLVQSGSTSAIRGRGAGTIVMISGGTITSANPDNFNPTINMSGSTIENVIITGGSVQATALGGYCVQTTGNVSVSGGTVTAINGRAINLVGMNSIAAISGGKIETTGTGHAVCTATTNPETVVNASVIVTGGLISSTSGDAIHVTGANSAVTIEGGIVQATTGYGIYGQNIYTPIDIYGGFVFAFGTDITGTPASNNVTNRPPHVTDGVLVAWNNPNSTPPPEYIVFSTDALIRNPAGATVVWYDDGTGGGIAYVNGNNSGFFNLDVIVQSLQPDIDGVLYVDLTKTGNGSSWEDAYPNLSRPLLYAAQQRSILLGSPTNLIKQIFIAEGTYKPLFETNGYHFDDKTFPEYDGGRNNAFILVPNLKIFGGFIPQNLTPPFSLNNLPSFGESGRNGVTTLSGDTNGDDIDGDFTQYRDDNTYHVVIGVGIDQDTETSIDGVTISGGHANLGNLISVNGVNNIDLDYGGGIYNRNSSPLLNNLIISDNYAMVRGGGVYNIDSSPSLANVDISKNTVGQQGGGIFNFNSNPSLFNVNISENESGNTGGGMVNRDGSSPTLVNVTVIGNNGAASGGGIRNYTNSSPILTNVLISGNKSTSSGGGIFNYDNSSPVMTNVTISGNYSGNQGGGISNEVNSFPVISNSVIWGNVASNAATNNVENVSGSNSSFTHSLIEGSIISGVWQTAFGNDLGNNIATNPMFLNLITPTSSNTPNILGDHRLNDLSPAIDAGNFILNATSTDLDGNPRVMGDNIDMGAYENEHAAIISPKPTDNILYIDHTKSGDGSSWEDAFPNLSLAMIYAAMQQADVSGTNEEEKIIEIRIAEGTHYPKFNADGYNFDNKIFPVTDGGRDNAFVLVPRVKTYGGFKPLDLDPPNSLNALPDYGETGRDGITIFSGDINGDDIEGDLSINKSDNVYHVVIAVGTVADNIIDQNTLLDGITITGGNADNIPWNITINGKTVNGGDSGGNYNDSASPMFNYVTINENIGTRRGGGMFNINSSPILNNVIISGNNANPGWGSGAGIYNDGSNPTLTNVIISDNKAIGDGGGIYNINMSSPFLKNVIINGNSCEFMGGGIFSENSQSVLINVTISGNVASSTTFGVGGGMYVSYYSYPILTNVTISGNLAADMGGGIFNDVSSEPQISNSIIWGNSAPSFINVHNRINSNPVFSNSLIEGSIIGGVWQTALFGTDGGFNIDDDPHFVQWIDPQSVTMPTTDGDYRLQVTSPAIEKGNNQAYLDALIIDNFDNETDLSGNPRLRGHFIDMGAYEYPLEEITNVAIIVTAPVVNVAPNNSASPDGLADYTIEDVFWMPGHNPFQGEQPYTVTVTIEANVGFIFMDLATATINGQPAQVTYNPDGTITISFTFEPLDKLDPDVIFPDGATMFYGQQLSQATLNGGTITTEGTFAFATPAAMPTVAQSGYFQLIFTPDDTNIYNIITDDIYVTVLPLTISISDVSHTKIYDGNSTALNVIVTLDDNDILIGDIGDVDVDLVTAEYILSTAGTTTLTITAIDLTGSKAENYTILLPETFEVDGIIQKTIGIVDVSHTKIYDGNTTGLNVIVTLDDNDILIGDIGDVEVDLVTAEYILSTAGTTTLTITAIDLTGSKAENYTILLPETFEVDGIMQRPIEITGFSITKIYDGTTDVLDFGNLEFVNLVDNENADVDISGVTANYASSEVGVHLITFVGEFGMLPIGLTNPNNYIITQPTGINGIITPDSPVIITDNLPDGIVGVPYNETLLASGYQPITWNIENGNLPDNLYLDSDTGIISGTPTLAGTYNFKVKATNDAGFDEKDFTIVIHNAPEHPMIITDELPDGMVGVPYNEIVEAVGDQPITWNIENGNLPNDLYLDSYTGIISGTPTLAGTFTFTIKATNDAGFDEKDFTIVIHNAPEHPMIITDELPDGMVGVPYNKIVEAVGDQPITWNIENGNLPESLNLDSDTGIISGTPTLAGTYTFKIKATNDAGFDEKDFTIVIHDAPEHPIIITDELPDGMVGVPYNEIVEAVGDQPITWNIENGNLPNDLNLDSETGIISGIPTLAGTYTFTIKATNDAGFDEKDFTIVIHNAPQHPHIYTETLPDGMVGVPYNEIVEAVGDQPITWNIEDGNLPNDLYLDSETGIISGTPTLAGTYNFKVKATNDAGFDEKDFTIVIHDAPEHPIIITEELPDGMVGVPYNEVIEAVGNTPMEWFMIDGIFPNGLSADLSSTDNFVIITGTPTLATTFTFTIRAINEAGRDEKEFTIIIHEAPEHPIIITEVLPDGMVGVPYNEIVEAIGDQPITWNLESGDLPNGLNFDVETAIISGMPSQIGTFTFTIKATNDAGFDEKEFTIIILDTPDHPIIITEVLPFGMVGMPYSAIIEAVGIKPITWEIEIDNGNLPDGLNLDIETGIISGIPTLEGVFTFTIKAENDAGFDKKEFTIFINNILVDDVVAEYGGDGRFYAMAFISCDDSSVKVEIETEDTSVVIEIDGIKENPHNVNLNNLNYGENEISVKINEQEYIVVIDKPVPFFDIVVLRWDNRLTVINNPENNHGYKFTSFQWYQNGQPAGTEQSWSADSNGNPINTNDIFYVEVEGHLLSNPDNIIKLRTCETHITWLHDHNLIVYPIPVSSGQTLWLETDIDDIEFYETAEIEVYDLLGIVIDKFRLQGRITTINISYNSGVYMFVLRNKDGFTKELKVTVK